MTIVDIERKDQLGRISRKPRKAIYKIHSFYKAVILGKFDAENFFIQRIQGELSCPKSTRKLSGLPRNVLQGPLKEP